MSISKIIIENFRNIKELEYSPTDINVIYGSNSVGKTNFLDSIAYADASDHEFHALLKGSYGKDSSNMSLSEIIKFNFFMHQKNLESFRTKVYFKESRMRLFEIWKTDPAVIASAIGNTNFNSPYIFVFDSVDPKQLIPRAIAYDKIESSYKAMKMSSNHWPINYVSPTNTLSMELIYKHCMNLSESQAFRNSIGNMITGLNDLETLMVYTGNKFKGIKVKTRDRQDAVPLFSCPNAMIKILTMLIFTHSTNKKHVLIDEFERDLTDQEITWLVSEICDIAYKRDLQLFVTTKRIDVNNMFNIEAGKIRRSFQSLHLRRIREKIKT